MYSEREIGYNEAQGEIDSARIFDRAWNMFHPPRIDPLQAQLSAYHADNEELRKRLALAAEIIQTRDAEGQALAEHLNRTIQAGKALQDKNVALRDEVAYLRAYVQTLKQSLRDHMADTLRVSRDAYLKDDPGPDLAWFNRPTVEPGENP